MTNQKNGSDKTLHQKSKLRLFMEGVLESLVFVFTFGIVTIGNKND